MTTHSIEQSLLDILTCIDQIDEFLGPKRDFSAYMQNEMLRSAVERKFSIIGEAINRILKVDPDYPLENARKIVDLRNLVVHSYDGVDDVRIWGIIARHLPLLREEVDRLLNP